MHHVSRTLRATLGLISALGCAHATRAPGPSTTPEPPAAPRVVPAIPRRDIAKLALGNAVVAVYARGDGRVEVGASAPGGTLLLRLAPSDVQQWARITTRILDRGARGRRGHAGAERSTLAEPGVAAGALTVSRRVQGRSATYTLFFSDRHYGGFPVQITRNDARVLVTTLRKAAAAALAMRDSARDSSAARPDSAGAHRRR